MNDPLANLLAYSFGYGLADVIQPRLPARFEPVGLPEGVRASSTQVSGETSEIPVSEQVVFPEIPSSLPPTVSPQSVIATPFNDMTSHRQTDAQPAQRLTPTVDGMPSAWGQAPTDDVSYPHEMRSAELTVPVREVVPDRSEGAGLPAEVVPVEHPPVFTRRRVAELDQEVDGKGVRTHVSASGDVMSDGRDEFAITTGPPDSMVPQIPSLPGANQAVTPRHPHDPHPPSRITISIGRVEVRAIPATSPPGAPRSRSHGPTPALSLNEYLRRRDGGRS